MFYNYVYLDPRKAGTYAYDGLDVCFLFEPIYIGFGSKNRVYAHWRRNDFGHPLTNKLTKIKKIFNKDYFKSFSFIIKEFDSKKDAKLSEMTLIEAIGRQDKNGGPLTNLTDGGEGSFGISAEARERQKAKVSGPNCYMYGQQKSQEVRAKISASLSGRSMPQEVKDKIKATTNSDEYKARRYDETWSKTSSEMQKGKRLCKWSLIDSNSNTAYETMNLAEFCKEHDLIYESLKSS
jgi:hypothetical protein